MLKGASTGFMVASGGVLSDGYGHGGPGVCLGDVQTEAEGVPSHRWARRFGFVLLEVLLSYCQMGYGLDIGHMLYYITTPVLYSVWTHVMSHSLLI